MPSDTLELLDSIVRGAEAATGKGAGQPLRAADWNALAEAVARLARLAAARERGETAALSKDFARADHAHLGEVGIAWFDPPTRALVEARGGAGDALARLDGLARDAAALRAELGALVGQVERLRTSLTDGAAEDRVRDATLRRFGDRLDGVLELDRRVTTLDGRVAGIDTGVRDALAFRDRLRDATGAPLDVAALAARVDGLAAAQDRLKLADGEVVRIRDFENRIAKLEDDGGAVLDLDGRIGTRLDALVAAPDGALVGRAAAAATATLEPRLATLEGGLGAARAELGTAGAARAADLARLDALDVRVATEGARGDRAAATLDTLGALPGRVIAVEAAAGAATQRLATVDALAAEVVRARDAATAAADLAPRLSALETTARALDGRVGAAETATAGIADLRGRVGATEASAARADALVGRVGGVEAQLGSLVSSVTVAESRLAALDTLATRVTAAERSTTELTSWRTGVDSRLGTLPDRAAVQDLTTRLASVERAASDQQTRIGAVERTATAQQLRLGQLGRANPGVSPVLAPVVTRPVG